MKDNSVKEIEDIMKGYNKEASINPEIQDLSAETSAKVETRGRKKGSKFKKEPESIDRSVTAGELISGAIILLFIDICIPNILALGYNAIKKKKGKKIEAGRMQLTDKQKNELEPLANEAAKQITLHGSPLTVFLVALLGIYGMNFVMLTQENK